MPLILTEVIAWAWEHESDLPEDRTRLLKRLTWMIAQRMYDAAVSSCGDLHSELSARCGGERGKVVLNPYAVMMHRKTPLPKQGWYLASVRHLENTDHRNSCKCVYEYACRNDPSKRHTLTISQLSTYYEFARFTIGSEEFYWWLTPTARVLIPECDWSLYVNGTNAHLHPTSRHHVVELTSFASGAVTWIWYDRTSMRAIVETTFTNSMTVTWNTRRYGEVGDTNPNRVSRVPFHREGAPTPLSRFVDYNEHIHDGSFFTRLGYVDAHLGKLVSPTFVAEVKLFPHLSELLTRQLRDRMYGIARKLLLVKAQWREEALAADPVKRCAACAVQAAKDQLVLGLEPAAKRACV